MKALSIRITLYLLCFLIMLPQALSFLICVHLIGPILFKLDLGRTFLNRSGKKASLWLLAVVFCLPLAVSGLTRSLPLGIDRHLELQIGRDSVSLLPSFWMLLMYLIPLAAMGRARSSEWTHTWTGGHLLRMALFVVAVLLPGIVQRLMVPDAFPTDYQLTQAGCLFYGLKSFYYNGCWEELYHRGLFLVLLMSRFGINRAIFVGAAAFALQHVDLVFRALHAGELGAVDNLLYIFLLGIALGWTFVRTRSVIPCVLIHGAASGTDYFMAALRQPVV